MILQSSRENTVVVQTFGGGGGVNKVHCGLCQK